MTPEQATILVRADVRRLWLALRKVEPALSKYRYDIDGQPTDKLCRLCGAKAAPDADVRHHKKCPFAELAFPAGAWVEEQEGTE